jgi:hypothetical protein
LIVDSLRNVIEFFELLSKDKELQEYIKEKTKLYWLEYDTWGWGLNKVLGDLRSVLSRYNNESKRAEKYRKKKEKNP